jgi:hypothetical protein
MNTGTMSGQRGGRVEKERDHIIAESGAMKNLKP